MSCHLETERPAFPLVAGLGFVGLAGFEPATLSLILIRHIRGMRSCWLSVGGPAHGRYGTDRGCPLGTGVVRPMWHANGAVLPARLLASSRPGTPPRVKGGRRPSRSDVSGSEHPWCGAGWPRIRPPGRQDPMGRLLSQLLDMLLCPPKKVHVR
jgi:hypothetical protein